MESEKETFTNPAWLRRFAAVVLAQHVPDALARAFRFSKKELRYITLCMEGLTNTFHEGNTMFENMAFRNGADVAVDAYIICSLRCGQSLEHRKIQHIKQYDKAFFPITAQDVIACGYKSGKELGQALRYAQRIWIDAHKKPDKEKVLDILKRDIEKLLQG